MADIIYTVNQDSPETIAGFEQYSQEDKALVSSFQINSVFDPTSNYSELHILSLSDELLESIYNYTGFAQLGNAQSAGQAGASVLTIDPIIDSKTYGYDNGGVKLLYHFLDDLYTTDSTLVDFFIQDISQDRTELSLSTLNLTADQLVAITSAIKTKLQSQSYFTGFRLNFKNNDLFIATNIDTLDVGTEKVVVVKLYEPLPTTYNLKSTLNIVDVVSDSVAYEIDAEILIVPEIAPTLRSPNFNIDLADSSVVPTGYYNYNELFSYPINNANSQIFSTVSEKGIDISVDYTTFSDFVHFSSAQERLLNFKYKLDLVSTYSASLASIASSTTGLQGVSGSREYYQKLLTGVVNNFDHYERFLYYESGSSSWPKSNTTKPYINKLSTNAESITWYADQIANAINYDQTNNSSLAYSIPTYLRDDANNENYLTFVYMVGQHFDNLWLYSKAVTDKYDADNRIDKGISKDLVAEALKNFGVKLYTSNKSVEDLFTTFIGQAYQSGSEKINFYITGSLTGSNTPIQPTAYDDYQKEVQKRIYHNLPLLLKSKGTERGLRALINCLGIPADILDIKLYGGRNTNERPFYGDYQYYTSSLDKVRLDNTGSLISGSTLSNYVSIIKRDNKYTDDLHAIEVGFSPTDNIDRYIVSRSLATFNIDTYLGDPGNLTSGSYNGLYTVAKTLLSGSLGTSSHYDLQDYVRLIKFFDNTVFKMVKDFIPARAVADTGIIIKPHLLNRSKAKSVILSGSRPEYIGSIDTAFISSSDSGWIRLDFTSSYLEDIITPNGIATISTSHHHEEPRYNGELQNSKIIASDGELNRNNPYKSIELPEILYGVNFYKDPPNNICILTNVATTNFIVQYTSSIVTLANIFSPYSNASTTYTQSATPLTGTTVTLTGAQYATFPFTGSSPLANCTASRLVELVQCNLQRGENAPTQITVGGYDLGSWFTGQTTNYNNQITVIYGPLGSEEIIQLTAAQTGSYNFSTEINPSDGEVIKVRIQDTHNTTGCSQTVYVTYDGCRLGLNSLTLTQDGRHSLPNFFTGTDNTPPITDSSTKYYFKPYTGNVTGWGIGTRFGPRPASNPSGPWPITGSMQDPNDTYWIRISSSLATTPAPLETAFNFRFNYTLVPQDENEIGEVPPFIPISPYLFDERISILQYQEGEGLYPTYTSQIQTAIGQVFNPDASTLLDGKQGYFHENITHIQFKAENPGGCIQLSKIISCDATDLVPSPSSQFQIYYANIPDWYIQERGPDGYRIVNDLLCRFNPQTGGGTYIYDTILSIYISTPGFTEYQQTHPSATLMTYVLDTGVPIFQDSTLTTFAATGHYGYGAAEVSNRIFGFWNSITQTWHVGDCNNIRVTPNFN